LSIHAIVLASGLLAVLLALALVREVRWRRALQKLVRKLLSLWRHRHEEDLYDGPGRGGHRGKRGRRL